MHPWPIRIGR